MRINEVFYSVSGEGLSAGLPTTFIRTQGCNLRCRFCDTGYSQDVFGGEEWTLDEVLQKMKREAPNCHYCLITGGEPLFQQEDVKALVLAIKNDYQIEIETNGSIAPPEWSSLITRWSVDMKCPSSGMQDRNLEVWFDARPQDQIKFVVSDERDLEFVRRMLSRHPNCRPTILISPVINTFIQLGERKDYYMPGVWFQRCAEFVKENNLRLSLQLHKFIYEANKRGV